MSFFARLLPFVLLSSLAAAETLAPLARTVQQASLDPSRCYRVRDLRLAREEAKIYFNDGFLMFGKPIEGVGVTVIFSAEDIEGGDAEVLLLPPTERERRALAGFTGSPNLNEHFRAGILIFTDDTAEELRQAVEERQFKQNPEMGNLLAERWNSILRSFVGSFEVRLVEDLLSKRRKDTGFFYAAFNGKQLGNFDIILDPRGRQQISVGQVVNREDRRFFDVWTNFESRSWRNGQKAQLSSEVKLEGVKIEADIAPDLTMKVISKLRVTPSVESATLAFELSQRMKVTELRIDNEQGEAYAPESLRANLLRSSENNLLLVAGARPFAAGRTVELTFHHEGQVILPAGDGIYFVSSRGIWYPNRALQFAPYDVTFRYPRSVDLVATGDLASETVEGDLKISRRVTKSPVRFFGFNFGEYNRHKVKRGELEVEVCGNLKMEPALQRPPRPIDVAPLPTPFPRRRGNNTPPDLVTIPPPPPDPMRRLESMAAEIAASFEDMATRFGKPPLPVLTVSPIPGRFGQGFPGLVYLSTLSYLDPGDRTLTREGNMQQIFFSQVLWAHEVAHQWWGNGVTSASYQDDWLMEGLANYSAMWILEKNKGARMTDTLLDGYRDSLLKVEGERTLESIGPVTLGHRLYTSQSPNAWSVITYQKGSWILHMLRRRLGDDAFQKLLANLYQSHLYKPVTTETFRDMAAALLPPKSPDPKLESFFENWVYGTGVPQLKLTTSVKGKAPRVTLTATLSQAEVNEDFSILVPIEIQAGRGKPMVQWVQTSNEPVTVTVPLPAAPTKVTLNPGRAVLTRQ
ncbi:MAG: hypothetical protein JNK87_03510 [Bryobacterales bacterium]|nr:hypothetical protein [Bryobacterales bacterium]